MYVKIVDGEVDTFPYSLAQLRSDNSQTSFPKQIENDVLESYGVYPVVYAEHPSINDRTQKAERNSEPTLVSGSWTVNYTTSNKTTKETAQYDTDLALSNRSLRYVYLTETDFYALSDVTMSSDMTNYRQALRDLSSHSNWPNLEESDWPTKP